VETWRGARQGRRGAAADASLQPAAGSTRLSSHGTANEAKPPRQLACCFSISSVRACIGKLSEADNDES
jgi:hypothetical protein